jgi:hypothetical protein
MHNVHTPACGSVASYTRKALQRLDQADVYTPRKRHSHASGGVVSLLFRCEAPSCGFRILDPLSCLPLFHVGMSIDEPVRI